MISEKDLNKKLKGKIVHTDGKGLWSSETRPTQIMRVQYDIIHVTEADEKPYDIKSMDVYLTKKSWDVRKHGLVYTDELWMKEFKKLLKKAGFVGKVSYSEQGMQGDNFVNLDWT